jgi:tyrosinase
MQVAMHINATGTEPGTHNNGFFLPFHRSRPQNGSPTLELTNPRRYLLWMWENVLADECGYKGPTPWWDWSLDSPERGGRFNSSPIWDAVRGFGGDGRVIRGNAQSRGRRMRCLADGPWANATVRLDPDDMVQGFPRCIERDFDAEWGDNSCSPKNLESILAQDRYEEFSELDVPAGGYQLDRGGPHAIGHMAVGGEVSVYSLAWNGAC